MNISDAFAEFGRVVKDDEAVAQLSRTSVHTHTHTHTHYRSAALTRTLLLGDRRGVQYAAVCVVCVRRRFVHTLLHPLHHQIQQRQHGLVHLRTGRRTRLEVGDSGKEEKKPGFSQKHTEVLHNDRHPHTRIYETMCCYMLNQCKYSI